MTSSARVAVKSVRSNVLPPTLMVFRLSSSESLSLLGDISVKAGLCLEWRSCMPNHADINVASHLANLKVRSIKPCINY